MEKEKKKKKKMNMRKKKKKKKVVNKEVYIEEDRDENFYYIAGYTSNGMPFGITWEEAVEEGLVEEDKLIIT